MGLNHLLLAALAAAPLAAQELYVQGPTNAIPALTQDLRALHLRDVGASRVYALRLPAGLRELNLSANALIALPEGFVPAGLRELNLSANALIALPEGFVPQGVARLWLADNRLTALPKEASGWASLEYLNLDRNLIATLPDLSRTRLRWLRLNNNRLTALPALPGTIERLYLADNRLTAAPAKPAALRHLILAGNPIAAVPDDLGAGLEWLDLSRTKVSRLPADLTPWRTLKVLNLARCPLSPAEKDRIEAAFDTTRTTLLF